MSSFTGDFNTVNSLYTNSSPQGINASQAAAAQMAQMWAMEIMSAMVEDLFDDVSEQPVSVITPANTPIGINPPRAQRQLPNPFQSGQPPRVATPAGMPATVPSTATGVSAPITETDEVVWIPVEYFEKTTPPKQAAFVPTIHAATPPTQSDNQIQMRGTKEQAIGTNAEGYIGYAEMPSPDALLGELTSSLFATDPSIMMFFNKNYPSWHASPKLMQLMLIGFYRQIASSTMISSPLEAHEITYLDNMNLNSMPWMRGMWGDERYK